MSNKSLIEAISFNVEETKPCQKKFNFTIDQDTVRREAGKITREFAGMVVIPGFRKGKAPVNMIMSRYENDIKSELKKHFYSAAFQKVTEDKSMDIVSYGAPSEAGEIKLDAEYQFALTFDVAPEFNLPEYKGIKVEVPAAEVSEEEVEKRVSYYKEMYAGYEDVTSPAQKDDMLKVSYTSDFAVAAAAVRAGGCRSGRGRRLGRCGFGLPALRALGGRSHAPAPARPALRPPRPGRSLRGRRALRGGALRRARRALRAGRTRRAGRRFRSVSPTRARCFLRRTASGRRPRTALHRAPPG